jgi:hypothetical protein
MGHLKTWPDRYRDGETYKAVDWDLRSLPAAFDELMSDATLRERLAVNGQTTLRRMFSDGGLRAFANRFESLVRGLNPD